MLSYEIFLKLEFHFTSSIKQIEMEMAPTVAAFRKSQRPHLLPWASSHSCHSDNNQWYCIRTDRPMRRKRSPASRQKEMPTGAKKKDRP